MGILTSNSRGVFWGCPCKKSDRHSQAGHFANLDGPIGLLGFVHPGLQRLNDLLSLIHAGDVKFASGQVIPISLLIATDGYLLRAEVARLPVEILVQKHQGSPGALR